MGGASEREHGEKSPSPDAQGDEEFSELGQVVDVALVDTGDDVPGEAGMLLQALHGHQHVLVACGVAPHPVVVVLEAVEADGDGLEAVVHKLVESGGGEGHAVRHHAPHEASLGDLLAAQGQVAAHHGLATGGDDHHLARVLVELDFV